MSAGIVVLDIRLLRHLDSTGADLDSGSGSLYKGWVTGYRSMPLIGIGVSDCGGTRRLREQSGYLGHYGDCCSCIRGLVVVVVG